MNNFSEESSSSIRLPNFVKKGGKVHNDNSFHFLHANTILKSIDKRIQREKRVVSNEAIKIANAVERHYRE